MDAVDAATRFIRAEFPDADAAFLGGSVVRGEATGTSDLDLLVVALREDAPFRASYRAFGWPIEAFVHTPQSCRDYFRRGRRARRPVLPTICSEGPILVDNADLAGRLRAEAIELLEQGPDPLTDEEIRRGRYHVTDLLDDFNGGVDDAELRFTTVELAVAASDLWLGLRRAWRGRDKWVMRTLKSVEPDRARALDAATSAFFRSGSRSEMTAWVEEVLAEAGGSLFEGYYERGRAEPSIALDHAQITLPEGEEERGREFYCRVLGIPEIAKPETLAGRGGFWLSVGETRVHVGTEEGVDRTATKAHLAYRVRDLNEWRIRLQALGVRVLDSTPIPGFHRFEFRDPFGNRVELIEPEGPGT